MPMSCVSPTVAYWPPIPWCRWRAWRRSWSVPSARGRVILLGTQPDDAWLKALIGRLVPPADIVSDPGVVVAERVTAEGKPAGAIIVNTTRDAASYRSNSAARILKGFAVEFVKGN